MTTFTAIPSTSLVDTLGMQARRVDVDAQRAPGQVTVRGIEAIDSVAAATHDSRPPARFLDASASVAPRVELAPWFGELEAHLVAGPALLRDFSALANKPRVSGVNSAPAHAVCAPVDHLRVDRRLVLDGATGFSHDVGGGARTPEMHLDHSRAAHSSLEQLTSTLEQLRSDPRVAERYPEVKYALDQKGWSLSAQSAVIIMVVLRDSPACAADMQAIAAAHASTSTEAMQAVEPTTTTTAAPADPVGDVMKGALGLLGPALSSLGPILQNPLAIAAITGVITTAIAAIPGAQVLLPIVPLLPVLLPLIGAGMTMAGGATSSGAAVADPVAALLGAGPSNSDLGGVVGGLGALVGAPAIGLA